MSITIDRVVLRLDTASENYPAVDTAARLAAQTKARLHGIFVEEEDLWHLAALPFARQVSPGTGSQPLTREHVEPHWRAAAERARRGIAAAAARYGVSWSFEVVRGSPTAAMSSADDRDLIVASAVTRPVAGHFRVEARWWSSLDTGRGAVLLTRRAWETRGSVAVVLRDYSAGSARLLDTAARMAEAKGALLVVIGEQRLVSQTEFKAWIAEHLASGSLDVDVEMTTGVGKEIRQQLKRLDCSLLVVEVSSAASDAKSLSESYEDLDCDLLIVR